MIADVPGRKHEFPRLSSFMCCFLRYFRVFHHLVDSVNRTHNTDSFIRMRFLNNLQGNDLGQDQQRKNNPLIITEKSKFSSSLILELIQFQSFSRRALDYLFDSRILPSLHSRHFFLCKILWTQGPPSSPRYYRHSRHGMLVLLSPSYFLGLHVHAERGTNPHFHL